MRVALREKYNSLLQRLKQSNVLGMNNCLSFKFHQDASRSCFLLNKDLSCNETNFHLKKTKKTLHFVFILQRGRERRPTCR